MVGATEQTPLVVHMDDPVDDDNHHYNHNHKNSASPKSLTKLLGCLQVALLFLFVLGTTYSSQEYSSREYAIARDIMVMLLLGFGFLMTFLRQYGLGAVGYTLLLTALAVQLNIFLELLCRCLVQRSSLRGLGPEEGEEGDENDNEDTLFPLPLRMSTLIDGEFAAGTSRTI